MFGDEKADNEVRRRHGVVDQEEDRRIEEPEEYSEADQEQERRIEELVNYPEAAPQKEFDKEDSYTETSVYHSLDKKVIDFMKSTPTQSPNGPKEPLETWKKLGPLDWDEVDLLSRIDTGPMEIGKTPFSGWGFYEG